MSSPAAEIRDVRGLHCPAEEGEGEKGAAGSRRPSHHSLHQALPAQVRPQPAALLQVPADTRSPRQTEEGTETGKEKLPDPPAFMHY